MNQPKKDPKSSKVIRHFSESFKRKIVKEIENKLTRVCDVRREFNVSNAAIYVWIAKYSTNHQKAITTVVQMESEQEKTRKLKQRVAELERLLGQKEAELMYSKAQIRSYHNLSPELKKKSEEILSNILKNKNDT